VLSISLESRASELDQVFRQVVAGDRELVAAARAAWLQYRRANGFKTNASLLTLPENQLKLGKSDVYSVGLTLQAADAAGVNTCAWAGQCAAVCVLKNGNGRYQSVQHARNVKTRFLADHPAHFVALLAGELARVAERHPKVLARLNVNSDLRWYRILPSLGNGDVLPNVYFYDYTKNPATLRGSGMVAERYRVCYSVNETSDLGKVDRFIRAGGTAAVVTDRKRNAATMASWRGLPVIDGDISDDRYSESGAYIDLTAKGTARQLIGAGGFVQTIYTNN